MNSDEDVKFRLDLATGFLKEAEQDFQLRRWRSCVDNAQLTVENSGKAILALFGVPSRTHEPARQVARFANNPDLPESVRQRIKEVLPDLLSLGMEEHFNDRLWRRGLSDAPVGTVHGRVSERCLGCRTSLRSFV